MADNRPTTTPPPGRLNDDLEFVEEPGGWPIRQPEPKPERGEWQD